MVDVTFTADLQKDNRIKIPQGIIKGFDIKKGNTLELTLKTVISKEEKNENW